ncbi:MAG: type I restriction endonuclease subunit R [Chitinophagales bacterium]|nr:type I restriction endonuclease subunit R [Chitinophagales bacterium]
MHTPSFQEDHISQIPALQFLQNTGYTYLSPEEALQLRGGKSAAVLLEGVLEKQLPKINSIQYKGQSYAYTESNIQAGISALKEAPLQEGLIAANETMYNLLTMGKALEQTIEGDKKSYTLQYINWSAWDKNVFHVTEEFAVQRAGSHEQYRPDIVLFVNGIPLVVIECKRPDMKEPLSQAISQHLRNQQEDGIRLLFAYAQILLSIATNNAAYATTATKEKFWSKWEEQFETPEAEQQFKSELMTVKHRPLQDAPQRKIFEQRFAYVQKHFDKVAEQARTVTEQDKYLYCLCRPERLLDLVFNFMVFDSGNKKITRYQQFFAIKKTMLRIRMVEQGKRQGGVIWHTQGSGKSLTMVMLAQAIALDKTISNPKVVIVTDRVDLDDQIYSTFKKCQIPVLQASTGKHLIELMNSKSDAVITTIINKFDTAVNQAKEPFTATNIFVLVDEGHRSQHGIFNIAMEKTFPNACFIAFTGTPLRKREKNTAKKFGGLIDKYTVDQAVHDQAVVPLLYEGRHAIQEVNERPIDAYFIKVSEPLNDYQRADLKRKFSRADQLNVAEQKIYCIAWDISEHYREASAGTDWKGQLVCQSKVAAIKYKKYLDEIGRVTSEILISPPDMREGEDSAYEDTNDEVKRFWKQTMDEFGGSPKKYEKHLINRFKHDAEPEIIIVVDKLLTGFDAPRNTFLYITRSLKEHTLLQAIARVNRVYPGKDYGYIIDYYGVLQELDEALRTYSSFQDFDAEDLEFSLVNINEEIKKLPQAHSELWDIFKVLSNKYDEPAYEEALRDDAVRAEFYDKLSMFARLLKLALSSIEWNTKMPQKEIERYKYDLGFFTKLRLSVRQRFADVVDFKSYENQIQKLIDKHVTSHEVQPITDLVNIFDKEKFEQEVEKIVGDAARADTIAHRTAKHINEKMEEDPAFYKKFSEMLKEAILAYAERRISEAEYLKLAKAVEESVLNRTGSDIPESLKNREIAHAFYGITFELIRGKLQDEQIARAIASDAGLGIDDLVQAIVLDNGKPKVDWKHKSDLIGQLEIAIGDFLMDHIRDKYGLSLSFGDIDDIARKSIEIAKLRYK